MKSTKFQSDDERSILTAMIVNGRVLARISAKIQMEDSPFRSRWANLVGKWCLEYHRKYDQAPQVAIKRIFQKYAGSNADEDLVAIVEKFLSSLDADWRRVSNELNENFLVDQASKYFNGVRLERLQQSIEDHLLRKEVEKAHREVSQFNPINLASSDVVNVLSDREIIRDAIMETESDVLIRYPRALGEFFGPDLQRDAFVAFLAPEKRGKSFWLMDLAWRAAILFRRRTLFYSLGDLSLRQTMRRFIVRACRRPLTAGEVSWPKMIQRFEDGTFRLKTRTDRHTNDLLFTEAMKAFSMAKFRTAASQDTLRLRCTPNSTTTVSEIRADIDSHIREGWVPDVVVLDYADILAPEVSAKSIDYRHQINETWKMMRRISQEYHILLATATQSDAASYDASILRRKHFSEDKRKLAHVTGMIGLNQTEEEHERGIYRLNWIARREQKYVESRCVAVAGSVALANPAMTSVWDVEEETKEPRGAREKT